MARSAGLAVKSETAGAVGRLARERGQRPLPGALHERHALLGGHDLADEMAALHWAAAVRRANCAWLVDVVQAYTSVAVFFDPEQIRLAAVLKESG